MSEKKQALEMSFHDSAFEARITGSFRDAFDELAEQVREMSPMSGATLAAIMKAGGRGTATDQMAVALSIGATWGLHLGRKANVSAPAPAQEAPPAPSRGPAMTTPPKPTGPVAEAPSEALLAKYDELAERDPQKASDYESFASRGAVRAARETRAKNLLAQYRELLAKDPVAAGKFYLENKSKLLL